METISTDSLLFRFLTACAIGMLVGIERGWREREAPAGSRTAGVRTYSIAALLGAVSAALAQSLTSPWPLCVALLVFVAVFAWFKMREIQRPPPCRTPPRHAVVSSLVSNYGRQKTGIINDNTRDCGANTAKKFDVRVVGDFPESRKARRSRAFLCCERNILWNPHWVAGLAVPASPVSSQIGRKQGIFQGFKNGAPALIVV